MPHKESTITKMSEIIKFLDAEIAELKANRDQMIAENNEASLNSKSSSAYLEGYRDGYTDKENGYDGFIKNCNK